VWKESYVVALFKNLKIFEKLVCGVITPIRRPLISDEQHGFVGGRSTVTSLVEFSNFVLSEMEDGLQVDAAYTDFSKAFDRVTRKLRDPMIFWMGSYLTGRTQQYSG
jgi:hypothetical protein